MAIMGYKGLARSFLNKKANSEYFVALPLPQPPLPG